MTELQKVRRELSGFARRRPELAARCRVIQHNLALLERNPDDERMLRQTAKNVAGLETAAQTSRE